MQSRYAKGPGRGTSLRPVRILVAGASGVIGVQLLPLLVSSGHEVTGMTRTPGKAAALAGLGATPLVCDVYDLARLHSAVAATDPDLVIDQLTDLPDDPAALPDRAAANNRIRRVGTANLLAAASGRRTLAQSVAWSLPGDGAAAVLEREQMVLAAGGVVLRYGQFYGPGTYYPDSLPGPPRIQVAQAARRTVASLNAPKGVIVLADAD